jgi:hypothetical protein
MGGEESNLTYFSHILVSGGTETLSMAIAPRQ